MKRISILSLLFVVSFMSVFIGGVPANANYQSDVLETGILIDADTGKILYEKNIDQPLPPASMVKMMSEYLILEAISNGDISWDDTVTINDFLVNDLSKQRELSNVPLRADEEYTVRELYESVAIYSANASVMALAEHIAGSEGKFVEMMNEKGKELGMGKVLREEGAQYGMTDLDEIAEAGLGDFEFVNSSGLPNNLLNGNHPEGTEANDDSYMSARATAILAYHLVNDFPEVLETASIPKKTFKEGTEDAIDMDNWNWMLEGSIEPQHDYKYIDGLKTGSTNSAGFCFTGTAEKDGQRLISVVMGLEVRGDRFSETERLMEYGFNNFSRQELFPADLKLEGYETIPVVKGKEDEISISTAEAVSAFIREGEEELYNYTVTFDDSLFDDQERLIAPVEENTVIGKMVVEYTGDEEETYLQGDGMTARSVDIVTNEAVEKAGGFTLFFRGIGEFFSGLWNSIAETVSGWF
ncbi:D-alanyl-D-alanine carboxypeptidase (penicillin-binding protein 5/6) [Evansella caseinilytica]|uniref:serine-type D-Ala-D-Ala carboxypeptidase n=1 Tax=Evansella caseinilytica TaxID=1503961 RepID=A0A1H3UYB3_9BACI|nr:D-alanyl-D-alanine carboxypeptidase family protein [Evansella caseinilytica]SDZ67347.1 D-alanyl-D-alanine carboxypeptidase (penicillin-binding protein 5/6) [Evansella caseinilytica]